MIPEELKQYRQWCVAAENKAPLNPYTGQYASVADPSTWGTYQEASQHGEVGFVFTGQDPYTVIDVDYGKPAFDDIVRWLRHAFPDTYTERSRGGKGYHTVVRGVVPRGFNPRDCAIEVYGNARFMILTGDLAWGTTTIRPGGEPLQVLCDYLSATAPKILEPYEFWRYPPRHTDEEVYRRTRYKNPRIGALVACGYPNQSDRSCEDLALFGAIARYTCNDEQVIRVFHMTACYAQRVATGWRTRDGRSGKCLNRLGYPAAYYRATLRAARTETVDGRRQYMIPYHIKHNRPLGQT